MATGPGVNQGKTAFVKKYFSSNPDGNLESVNKAWTAAGNEGTLSESLVGKVRARLGLTGKKTAGETKPAEASKTSKSKAPTKVKKKTSTPAQAPAAVNGSISAVTPDTEDDDTLDELEDDIDKLIQKIRDLGSKPAVVKALRRARRLLFSSH